MAGGSARTSDGEAEQDDAGAAEPEAGLAGLVPGRHRDALQALLEQAARQRMEAALAAGLRARPPRKRRRTI